MRNVDYIIVGQGLAGTCLAWSLHHLGARIVVIDRETPVTSSRIAAGLITPVTGQRFVKTWRFDELRKSAWDFYREIEQALGTELLRETSMLKVFQSTEERSYYEKRRCDPAYAELLSGLVSAPDGINAPHGCCELLRGGQLRVTELLDRSRERFIRDEMYLVAEVALPEDVNLVERGVFLPRWNLSAHAIVFCEGIAGRRNPWFPTIEFNPARGEMLTVKLPSWNGDQIVHGGGWVAPISADIDGQRLYRVGATYDWDQLEAGPTVTGGQALIAMLRQMTRMEFEVVEHQAAVRPILKHLNPIIGRHAHHPQIACFNGLASKGSLQAPFMARMMASHLVHQKPIDREVDLQLRFPVPGAIQ